MYHKEYIKQLEKQNELIHRIGNERVGDVSNVVFTNGAVVREDDTADTRVHVATSTIERLLDYAFNNPSDPLDANGNQRELHIQKALDVINLDIKTSKKQEHYLVKGSEMTKELLLNSKYFNVERLIFKSQVSVDINAEEKFTNTFKVLLCIDGNGKIEFNLNEMLPFSKGDCIFIPANCNSVFINGNAKLLKIIG